MNTTLTPTPSPATLLWTVRVGVVLTGVLVGLTLASAGQGRQPGAAMPGMVTWWVIIAAVLVAVVVPGALGLTLLRLALPLAPVAAAGSLIAGASPALGSSALAAGLVTAAAAFSAEAGEAMVQGAAYGHEQRFVLRLPAATAVPVVLSWMVWAAAVVAAVVLLGAQSWLAGAGLAVLALVGAWLLGRRVHRFSRRWLVVVPAGVVVHDHVVLGDTMMVPTPNVRRCGLAFADTQALDLTGPAAGHALEVVVGEMVTPLLAATRAQPKGTAIHAASFLVAPSRPGRALAALAAAGLPTG